MGYLILCSRTGSYLGDVVDAPLKQRDGEVHVFATREAAEVEAKELRAFMRGMPGTTLSYHVVEIEEGK